MSGGQFCLKKLVSDSVNGEREEKQDRVWSSSGGALMQSRAEHGTGGVVGKTAAAGERSQLGRWGAGTRWCCSSPSSPARHSARATGGSKTLTQPHP